MSQIVITCIHLYNLAMFFTHNTQYSLLFLIHVQIQCDLAITKFTCVNVWSQNCLELFLKYKNWLDLFSVCVCVLNLWAWHFFLLRDLFFTCFASFYYLVIRSTLFHYIHAFIWIFCAPLIIIMSLGWNFLASCTLCQSWQKGGEIVEILWFLFLRFYMLEGEIHASIRGRCVSSW